MMNDENKMLTDSPLFRFAGGEQTSVDCGDEDLTHLDFLKEPAEGGLDQPPVRFDTSAGPMSSMSSEKTERQADVARETMKVQTQQNNGDDQKNARTVAQRKEADLDRIRKDYEDNLFGDNMGKFMAMAAGTAMQMIALNNNYPGLFMAGSGLSILAKNELDEWKQGYRNKVANILSDEGQDLGPRDRTAFLEKAQEEVNKTGEKLTPEKARGLAKILGVNADNLPELVQAATQLEPERGLKSAVAQGAMPNARTIVSQAMTDPAFREAYENKDAKGQSADIDMLLGNAAMTAGNDALGILIEDPGYNDFKKEFITTSENATPYQATDSIEARSVKPTTARKYGEEILGPKEVIVSDEDTNERLLRNIEPGTTTTGRVMETIRDTILEDVKIKDGVAYFVDRRQGRPRGALRGKAVPMQRIMVEILPKGVTVRNKEDFAIKLDEAFKDKSFSSKFKSILDMKLLMLRGNK
jgi:hypothetical protein